MLTEAYLLKKYGPLITVEQLAEIFHTAVGTMENRIAQGKAPLKPLDKREHGKKMLFHYAAVARAIDAADEALSA